MRPIDAAADRFFRAYHAHCTTPGKDTLFNLLNALHSFHDKFQKATGSDLFGSANVHALKALRNLFHHHSELADQVKVVQVSHLPLMSDLMVLCLIDRQTALDAIDRDLQKRTRQVLNRDDIIGALKWYGPVANVNPCVFNCAVEIYEAVRRVEIAPSSSEFQEFEASYEFEEEHGHSHRVTGDIQCHAGNVNEVLRQLFAME